MAGASLVPTLFLPETYLPILAQRKAAKLRKETGDRSYRALIEKERQSYRDIVTVFMARPLHMLATESIVMFTALYLALATGIYCT